MNTLWLKNVGASWKSSGKNSNWLGSAWKSQRNSHWLGNRPAKAGVLISR